MYVIVQCTRVSAFVQSCAENCSDKRSLLVSHCLRTFFKYLSQTSLCVVRIQVKVVLRRRLKLTVNSQQIIHMMKCQLWVCCVSFICLFILLFVRSFLHCFVHSFIHFFIYSFVHSFVPLFLNSSIHSFIDSFIDCALEVCGCCWQTNRQAELVQALTPSTWCCFLTLETSSELKLRWETGVSLLLPLISLCGVWSCN